MPRKPTGSQADAKAGSGASEIEQVGGVNTEAARKGYYSGGPSPERKRPKSRNLGPRPNIPSFDHTGGKNPKPILGKGETIVSEGEWVGENIKPGEGVKWVFTTSNRRIYLCDIATYLEKVGPLRPSIHLFEQWYPHAAQKRE